MLSNSEAKNQSADVSSTDLSKISLEEIMRVIPNFMRVYFDELLTAEIDKLDKSINTISQQFFSCVMITKPRI